MKNESIRAIPWRLVLASVVFLGGCGWAIVTIMQSGITPTLTVSPPSSQKPVALVAQTPPVRAPMEESERQAAKTRVSELVNASLIAIQTQSPSASDAALIAKEAAESLLLAVNPSADRYVAYLAGRGEPDSPFIKMTPQEREESLRTISQCFAGQQPDLSKVQVRWRYIDGREIDKPKDRGANATPKRSLDAINNPASSGLTVMEVIVPVPAKTLTKGTKPCRLGFWIGKTRANPKWSTMKVYTYDIPGNVPILLPPI